MADLSRLSGKAVNHLKYRHSDFINRTTRKNKDDSYPFNRRINRLRYEEQIEPLFDNPNKVKRKSKKGGKEYSGKIGGISAKIDFHPNFSCNLYAKTKDDLTETHKKVLDFLLGKN